MQQVESHAVPIRAAVSACLRCAEDTATAHVSMCACSGVTEAIRGLPPITGKQRNKVQRTARDRTLTSALLGTGQRACGHPPALPRLQ